MITTLWQNKLWFRIIQYAKLMRLNKPIPFLLLFFPCAYGLVIAGDLFPKLSDLAIFFFGSIVMRSAGCIVNDILDRDIDKFVERTKSRPLASGLLSLREALSLLLVLLLTALVLLLQLSPAAIYLGCIIILPVLVYPLFKRFTYWPQLFLGIVFNFGLLIAYAHLTHTISIASFMLYLACVTWTVIYDTAYAMSDLEDDLRIGVKSTAILFGDGIIPILSTLAALMIALLFVTGIIAGLAHIYYFGLVVITAHLAYQILRLANEANPDYQEIFTSNRDLGFLLLIFLFLGKF